MKRPSWRAAGARRLSRVLPIALVLVAGVASALDTDIFTGTQVPPNVPAASRAATVASGQAARMRAAAFCSTLAIARAIFASGHENVLPAARSFSIRSSLSRATLYESVSSDRRTCRLPW